MYSLGAKMFMFQLVALSCPMFRMSGEKCTRPTARQKFCSALVSMKGSGSWMSWMSFSSASTTHPSHPFAAFHFWKATCIRLSCCKCHWLYHQNSVASSHQQGAAPSMFSITSLRMSSVRPFKTFTHKILQSWSSVVKLLVWWAELCPEESTQRKRANSAVEWP